MENRFDKLEVKVDRLDARLDSIDINLVEQNGILAAQHESLKEHMKRSDMLEAKVLPIEKFHDRVKFTGILLFSLGGLLVGLSELGVLSYLMKLLSRHAGR